MQENKGLESLKEKMQEYGAPHAPQVKDQRTLEALTNADHPWP